MSEPSQAPVDANADPFIKRIKLVEECWRKEVPKIASRYRFLLDRLPLEYRQLAARGSSMAAAWAKYEEEIHEQNGIRAPAEAHVNTLQLVSPDSGAIVISTQQIITVPDREGLRLFGSDQSHIEMTILRALRTVIRGAWFPTRSALDEAGWHAHHALLCPNVRPWAYQTEIQLLATFPAREIAARLKASSFEPLRRSKIFMTIFGGTVTTQQAFEVFIKDHDNAI